MMSTRFLLLALQLVLLAVFPAARAQTYYLDLTHQALTLSDNTLAVEKVVDGRAGQPPIGIVYRGLSGKSAAVDFRQGLETELTHFLQVQLPSRPTNGHTIVLCLRSLHVGETMGGNKQQAVADLRADVYEHLPTGYHFVRSVGSYASAYGRETTGRHAGHLVQILNNCFRQLSEANWAETARQPARTLAQLPADVPAPLAAGGKRGPAILREVPRRGLYFRFEQFLTNQPDTLTPLVVDTVRRRYQSQLAMLQWLRVARVQPLVPDGTGKRTVPRGLWGFSDGQQVFMLHAKQFFPLLRQGNSFTFIGEAPVDQLHAAAEAQAQARAGVLAGMVGGALARTRVPDHTAEPMAYGLDLGTGAAAPYPSLHSPVRADTAYVYIYRSLQAIGAEPLKVYVDGRQMGSLGPGQYLEVPWFHLSKPLELCIGDWPVAKPCQYLVPNTAQLNYLKINAPTDARPWQWVPPTQGAADLDELDRLAK